MDNMAGYINLTVPCLVRKAYFEEKHTEYVLLKP